MQNKGQYHASSFAAFDNMFVLMVRRNLLPPSSRRLNSVTVVCGMTGRRECVHYVAVLATIRPGCISLYSD